MELSATAKVILGMLAMRPRSGYEIKSFVDDSTRYFWAASYGQIYPELKRLAENGLIEGTRRPDGRQAAHRLPAHRCRGKKRSASGTEGPRPRLEMRDEGC